MAIESLGNGGPAPQPAPPTAPPPEPSQGGPTMEPQAEGNAQVAQAQQTSPQELAKRAVESIQRMKVDLVRAGSMLQWEADHYFEAALKHLNGV